MVPEIAMCMCMVVQQIYKSLVDQTCQLAYPTCKENDSLRGDLPLAMAWAFLKQFKTHVSRMKMHTAKCQQYSCVLPCDLT
jgi:hypothetical protein